MRTKIPSLEQIRSSVFVETVAQLSDQKILATPLRLMTLSYFQDKFLGVKLGYDFRQFHPGPFSIQVLDVAARMRNRQGVVTRMPNAGEMTYTVYSPGKKAADIIAEALPIHSDLAEVVAESVTMTSGLDDFSLARLGATAHYARQMAPRTERQDLASRIASVQMMRYAHDVERDLALLTEWGFIAPLSMERVR